MTKNCIKAEHMTDYEFGMIDTVNALTEHGFDIHNEEELLHGLQTIYDIEIGAYMFNGVNNFVKKYFNNIDVNYLT